MFVFDTSYIVVVIMFLAVICLSIYLGKELKKSILPQIVLGVELILLVLHTIQLFTIASPDVYGTRDIIIRSMRFDYIYILITFFGYLWIDDIEAKVKNKKSVDNSLDWFWKKV